MDTDKDRAIQKQLRIDFILSLIVGSILLAMGIFVHIVYKYYSDFGESIGLPFKIHAITGFPLFDILGYLVQFQFAIIILGIYRTLPIIFGAGIILASAVIRLLERKFGSAPAYYRASKRLCAAELCLSLINIVEAVGFTELGIYPKIYTAVNLLTAAAVTAVLIKRPKIKDRTKKLSKEYIMKISPFFRSIVDSDIAPIVICETDHKIIYMNPAAVERYENKGGAELIGQSLLDCHNDESNEKIKYIVDWFGQDLDNNRIFTFHNPKENKDVYMIALRDEKGKLIGYYEKHEYRTPEAEL